ncbi:MAG: DUF177 domain-containing protein [Bradyrhizobium sp.]|uniref:YceD family protein n=1 Tax=Bradyrhizobium sp. TaxID=376 RepID=UPI003D127DB5
MTSRQDRPDPWRSPVVLAQIPERGLHRELDADEAQRKAMAEVAGLREVLSARASFDVTPKSGGRFQVSGVVRARIGQTCVVTLDPIETEIDEEIDLTFAPPEQIPALSALADDAAEGESDPPEPIEGGIIDLGRLATDALFLGIDPYPRKPDAVFHHGVTPPDPEDHPFAALKALQVKPKAKRKPKRK